jgi:hypothetical protein
MLKRDWPAYITDQIGLPSVQGSAGPWVSAGDTTDVAWFHAMCDFLHVGYPGERIRAMQAILEAAGGTWDPARHSSTGPGKKPGGNVRVQAFEDLWLALQVSGRLTNPSDPRAVDAGVAPLPERRWVYQYICERLGQPAFRRRLLTAYGGRCAISGSDIRATLEAAHIVAHAQGGRMVTTNGLLLRADLHSLFDLGLIAIDVASWTVLVHDSVRQTKSGAALHGALFTLPANAHDRPDVGSLHMHREQAGL